MIDLTSLVVDELARIYPDATIYTENQSSGFKQPSFYVNRIPVMPIKPGLFDIQERTYSYQVVYFANPDQPNKDIENVQDLLSDNFTHLADQANIINREFSTDSNENTLILQFDVWLRMIPEDLPKMKGEVKTNGGIRSK